MQSEESSEAGLKRVSLRQNLQPRGKSPGHKLDVKARHTRTGTLPETHKADMSANGSDDPQAHLVLSLAGVSHSHSSNMKRKSVIVTSFMTVARLCSCIFFSACLLFTLASIVTLAKFCRRHTGGLAWPAPPQQYCCNGVAHCCKQHKLYE